MDTHHSAVLASRLVKSPDSHAREPRSLLGGSSWLCNKNNQGFLRGEDWNVRFGPPQEEAVKRQFYNIDSTAL